MSLDLEVKEIIDSSQGVILSLHPFPDLDSLGSVLAMANYLQSINKRFLILEGQTSLPERFKIISGTERVIQGDFKDNHLNEYDLFLAIDQSSIDRATAFNWQKIKERMKIIVIDHHKTNEMFGDINLLRSDYASTAEIIAELFESWNFEINSQTALYLLLGIHDDTGGFSFGNLRPKTFSLAGKLFSLCPDYITTLSKLKASNEPGHLKFISLALRGVKTCLDGKLAYSTLSLKDLTDNGLSVRHFENQEISNILITVKDWPIGVTLFEKSLGEIFISCRSQNNDFDVSLLASEFGGGGHKQAAGASMRGSMKEVEKKLITIANKLYS